DQREWWPVLNGGGGGAHLTSMRQALTTVYLSGMVGIDSHLCLGVIGMSDQTDTGLREQVRSRYAAAARAVLEPRPGVTAHSVELAGTGSCCGSSAVDSG